MKIINVPNLLTLFRVGLIPVLVIIFYLPDSTLSLTEKNILGTFIFSVAAITDWLDGYLARKLKQTSKFGAFLDPVADKLIVDAKLKHEEIGSDATAKYCSDLEVALSDI